MPRTTLADEEVMKRLYLEDGLTLQEIADQYAVSRQRIGQIIGPQRKKAHYGHASKNAVKLEERRPSFDRIMAGESTMAQEAEIVGMGEGALREFLDRNGLHVPTKYETSPKHGTVYRYGRGCKCSKCKKAMKEQKREMKEREEPPNHGLSGYINYACRCDICRAAGSQANRDSRERRQRRQEESK